MILAIFISEDDAAVKDYADRVGLDYLKVADPNTTIASAVPDPRDPVPLLHRSATGRRSRADEDVGRSRSQRRDGAGRALDRGSRVGPELTERTRVAEAGRCGRAPGAPRPPGARRIASGAASASHGGRARACRRRPTAPPRVGIRGFLGRARRPADPHHPQPARLVHHRSPRRRLRRRHDRRRRRPR